MPAGATRRRWSSARSVVVAAGSVGEEFADALLVEAGDVCPGAVELAVKRVAFSELCVALGAELLVFLTELVAVVLDPGAVGFAQLTDQVSDELALLGELTADGS